MKKIFPFITVALIVIGTMAVSFTSTGLPVVKTTMATQHLSHPVCRDHGKTISVTLETADSYLLRKGKPVLPSVTKTFEFPVGTKITGVHCTPGSIKTKRLSKNIHLASSPAPVGMVTAQKKQAVKHSTIHPETHPTTEATEVFPAQWFDYKVTTGLHDGKTCVFLTINYFPARYAQESSILQYTCDFATTISYQNTGYSKGLGNTDDGYYDLLVITPQRFVKPLTMLKEHKEEHGVKTNVTTLDYIYNTYEGRDKPEQIKRCIQDAVEVWGVRYVLLVGGMRPGLFSQRWYLPVRYTHLDDNSDWERGYISDLYYADIYQYDDGGIVFDDWDSNGNGVFAEWTASAKDELDLVPDVYLGRLPCRNAREVKTVVNKIITYENTAYAQDWFNKMVAVGGDTFPSSASVYEGEVVTSQSLDYMSEFEAVKLYVSDGDFGAKDIRKAINAGCGFVHFAGHGNPASWATHPPHNDSVWTGEFNLPHMAFLRNKNKYPICVVGGCHNSQFNVSLLNLLKLGHLEDVLYKSEWAPECWSWWLTRKNNGGAIATIGNTGLGYGTPGESVISGLSGWLESHFFKVYGEQNEQMLGAIHGTAIHDYINNFSCYTNPYDCKTVQQWALFGDPSLKVGGYAS